MRLVDQWAEVERSLPQRWEEVRLTLRTEQPSELARAAQMLGPMNPCRVGDALVFYVCRAGGASGPEAARRLFACLDRDRVWCMLSAGEVRDAAAVTPAKTTSAAAQWAAALETLPDDWSDLLGEIEVASSDQLPRVALLCAPVNPTRDLSTACFFTFRSAHRAGYGVSPAMAHRCFERIDEEGIVVRVGIRGVLADARNADTQGVVTVTGSRAML